eukprot:3152978-Rhodomonas_salina.1
MQFSDTETTEDVEIVRRQEMRSQSTGSSPGRRPGPPPNGSQVAKKGLLPSQSDEPAKGTSD